MARARCTVLVLLAALALSCSGGSGGGEATVGDCTEGGSCTTTDPCHQGTISCANGAARCVATNPLPDGTSCGAGLVCRSGACVAPTCIANRSCQPTNPC